MHSEWQRISNEFIEATSYEFGELGEAKFQKYDPAKRPPTYLSYPDALVKIPLGRPSFPASPDMWQLIENRRSRRNFIGTPLTLNELNILLWGTQGITADMGDYQLRTTSSAGALYPIETYLLVNNVEGLSEGLYHLDVQNWCLEGIKLENVADFAYQVTDGQDMTVHAAVNFVWTAVVPRTRAKYEERAYRYIWWDSGHVAQNLHIVGNGLGLGVSTMGHWYDKEMNQFLGIDGKDHLSVLMASVGKVEGKDWLQDRRPPKVQTGA